MEFMQSLSYISHNEAHWRHIGHLKMSVPCYIGVKLNGVATKYLWILNELVFTFKILLPVYRYIVVRLSTWFSSCLSLLKLFISNAEMCSIWTYIESNGSVIQMILFCRKKRTFPCTVFMLLAKVVRFLIVERMQWNVTAGLYVEFIR